MTVNARQTGTAFALFFGGIHLLWCIVVAAGGGQRFADFILSIHFIAPTFRVLPFHLSQAVGLIAVTTMTGFLFGWTMGTAWNLAHKYK